MTNKKSHMGCRLVPNSVTLDDLERRNSATRCVISPTKFGSFLGGLRKMVGDTPILSVAEM